MLFSLFVFVVVFFVVVVVVVCFVCFLLRVSEENGGGREAQTHLHNSNGGAQGRPTDTTGPTARHSETPYSYNPTADPKRTTYSCAQGGPQTPSPHKPAALQPAPTPRKLLLSQTRPILSCRPALPPLPLSPLQPLSHPRLCSSPFLFACRFSDV